MKEISIARNLKKILLFCVLLLSLTAPLYAYTIIDNVKCLMLHSRHDKFDVELERYFLKKKSLYIVVDQDLVSETKLQGIDLGFRHFFTSRQSGWFTGLGVHSRELEDLQKSYLEVGVKVPFKKTWFFQGNYLVQIFNISPVIQVDPIYKFYIGRELKRRHD